jgi:hypothetical protein
MGFPTLLNCLFLAYGPIAVTYFAKKDLLQSNLSYSLKGLVSALMAIAAKVYTFIGISL